MVGLALPIARRLTEPHGGKLLLNSEPGKDTTVRVSLPARPVEVTPPADEPERRTFPGRCNFLAADGSSSPVRAGFVFAKPGLVVKCAAPSSQTNTLLKP